MQMQPRCERGGMQRLFFSFTRTSAKAPKQHPKDP
jgi:hypothetical protein